VWYEYLKKPMRKVIRRTASLVRPIITAGLGLALALFSAAITYSAPAVSPGNIGAAALFLQPTTTPQPQDHSEIGSTDGIIAMGLFIALIIIIPILLQRKSWMESR
jgi:hypothetical protein